jgi:hypothetical protein
MKVSLLRCISEQQHIILSVDTVQGRSRVGSRGCVAKVKVRVPSGGVRTEVKADGCWRVSLYLAYLSFAKQKSDDRLLNDLHGA